MSPGKAGPGAVESEVVMSRSLRIASSTLHEALVLQLSGVVDGTSGSRASRELADATASAPPPSLIVVDLSQVEVLTAAGVRLLRNVAHTSSAKGVSCRFLVPAGDSAVAHVFDAVDPEHTLIRYPDLHHCLTVAAPPSDRQSNRVGDGGRSESNSLAQVLSDMARSLHDQDKLDDTLNAITAAAVNTVPGAEYAGLMVVHGRRRIESTAMTADLVAAVDQAQYATGEGPCLTAIDAPPIVRVTDMAHETRWPEFSRRAVQLGVLSMLSFQLYVIGDKLGGLNLYARRPHAFDEESQQTGHLFATHAAIAMAGAQREDDLARAVAGRDIVGQAKGILMERYKITSDNAFQLLVRTSQHTNTKLTEVARYLTETGQIQQH
jgi:anti-anti-sigma regulatory factor